jgi:hypothetical protein
VTRRARGVLRQRLDAWVCPLGPGQKLDEWPLRVAVDDAGDDVGQVGLRIAAVRLAPRSEPANR